jgi:uncharacterized protein (UPF0264 family)
LLVSVRSAAEAQAALAGGADLIDVKEPHLGSLGSASPQVWREVAAVIGDARPLSAALGELLDFQPLPPDVLTGYCFAKLGLAGCAKRPDWQERWRAALATFPAGVSSVAVVYADSESAAPKPQEILRCGHALGCRALLVDTFRKQQGDVFDHLAMEELIDLFAQARSYDMRVVLAGSLSLSRLTLALELSPDYVAVRGALCKGNRAGELDESLVCLWAERLRTISSATGA